MKWAVREDGWETAASLIGSDLLAPDLVRAELANALLKKVRRREIAAAQALATQVLVEASLVFVPSLPFSVRALEIALELDHPVYDCFFLALAELGDTVIVTADRKLSNRCAGTRFSRMVEML